MPTTIANVDGVTVELDYDASDNLTQWRIINANPDGKTARVTITQISNGRSRSGLVIAGRTVSGNISTGQAQRIRRVFVAAAETQPDTVVNGEVVTGKPGNPARWDAISLSITVPGE